MLYKDTLQDVIIVGAGPIGILLALLLKQRALIMGAPCSVAIVDKYPHQYGKISQKDGRTFALTAQTALLLQEIDLWDQLESYACPIQHVLVTEGNAQEGAHFDHHPGGDPLGYILEGSYLKEALIKKLFETPSVTFIPGVYVEKIQENSFFNTIWLQNRKTLKGRLVIGADGRYSALRAIFSIQNRVFAYPQKALVCHFAHSNPHRGWAVESFFPQGPFATLPMVFSEQNGYQSGVVWSDAPHRIRELEELSHEDFNEALRTRIDGHRYGEVSCVSHRWIYELVGGMATHMIAHRMALVGDAAHIIHPVAGQGLNLGIKDIETLSLMVSHALSLGLDPGRKQLLEKYQRLRRLESMGYLGVTHGLMAFFKEMTPEISMLRHEGLRLLDGVPSLKKWIMKMGTRNPNLYGLHLERTAMAEAYKSGGVS